MKYQIMYKFNKWFYCWENFENGKHDINDYMKPICKEYNNNDYMHRNNVLKT